MDFSYLETFLGGDVSIALEVLALFRQQAPGWEEGLDSANPEWRAAVHTIKGAARGVGARSLGDACEEAERTGPEHLPQVRQALAAALADIKAYEARQA